MPWLTVEQNLAFSLVKESDRIRVKDTVDSYLNLWDNLLGQGDDPSRLGIVLQLNKRDLSSIFSVSDLSELLNHTDSPTVEACALTGEGVFETLKVICKQVIAKSAQ